MTEPAAYLDTGTEVNHKDSFLKIECNNRWYGAWGVSWLAGLETGSFLADAFKKLICIKRHTLQVCLKVLLMFLNSCQEDDEKREQIIPVTTGGFIAISKLQVAGPSSLLLLFLLYSVVCNWGGKGCLVGCVFLCVLLAFNSVQNNSQTEKKEKRSASCGVLCRDGLLRILRVQPKMSFLIYISNFYPECLKRQTLPCAVREVWLRDPLRCLR